MPPQAVPLVPRVRRRTLAVVGVWVGLATLVLFDVRPVHAAPQTAGPAAAAANGESALAYRLRRGVLLVLVGGVLAGIVLARRGWVLPSRPLPGVQAIEEAIGRATELGRPALFTVGGACDLQRVQLFASMPVLREAARLSGRLDNRLLVPVCYPETLSLHVNALRDGYLDAGLPESYRGDDVRFFPGGLFFFALATMGWMLQEQPAACFYFGHWEADALLLTETGQTVGAMQIAGTDALPQVPFFVASCDHTLIGEEFWAASARISQDPDLLGSLGAQDVCKLAVLVLIVVGCLLCVWPPVADWFAGLQQTFR